MHSSPLSLSDLRQVSAKDAATQNIVLSAIFGRIYQIAGVAVTFDIATPQNDALKVALQFNGQNIVLGLSESVVNALLKGEGASLSECNEDILSLVVRLKLIAKLPKGLEFKGIYLATTALPDSLRVLPCQVALQGRDAQSAEALDWNVAIYALPQTGLGMFLKSFDFLVTKRIPSPLLKARVPMPIVAASTTVPAHQLNDLAVGDVILIN